MGQNFKKIFWRVGQEITPETFIQADNYICGQQNLIRRLIAGRYFGLLPQNDTGSTSLSVKASLNDRDVYIENLSCKGVTKTGYIVEFENNFLPSVRKKLLTVPGAYAKAYYIVLRVNPFEQVLIEPVEDLEAPLSHSVFEFDIRELEQIGEDELSILKITNSGGFLKIDDDYIPPGMSVDSYAKLIENYEMFKKLIADINSYVNLKKEQYRQLIYPLRMLCFELDEFPVSDTPASLIRLIKKFILSFTFFIPEIRKIDNSEMNSIYNHNDVSYIFKSLIMYLQEVQTIVSKDEKVVVEEDFTPKI